MDGGSLVVSPVSILALLGAAATGGSVPFAYWTWALRAASSPMVQDSIQRTANSAIHQVSDIVNDISVDRIYLQSWMVFGCGFGIGCLFTIVLVLCCGYCVCSSGGVWYLGRRSIRRSGSSDFVSLYIKIVNFISNNGDPAFNIIADELGISEKTIRDWWMLWRRVLLGPRRL